MTAYTKEGDARKGWIRRKNNFITGNQKRNRHVLSFFFFFFGQFVFAFAI